jgi:3-deoxy-D-manno-octulosonic-acid transferase
MGPYIRNGSDIAQQFIDEGGMKIVHTALDLVEEIQLIQSSEAELQRRVEALSRVMMRNKGALDRVEKLVVQAMEQPTATIHR